MTQAGFWIDWRVWKRLSAPRTFNNRSSATGRVNSRKCTLTHEVILWVVLAMGLFTELPIRQVFKHARRLRKGEESPHRSSLCVARQAAGRGSRYVTCSPKSSALWPSRLLLGHFTAGTV